MTYTNPFAEFFKGVDFNQALATHRLNVETATAAGQVFMQGAQEVFRRSAEVVRENTENVLKASKEAFSGNTGSAPESYLAKQTEVTKTLFDNTLSNLRDITEVATKSYFEGVDLLNRRTGASLDEMSTAASKTAEFAKKKAA